MGPIIKAALFLLFSIILTGIVIFILMVIGLPNTSSAALATLISGILIVWIVKAKTKLSICFSKVKIEKLGKYVLFLLAFRFVVFLVYRFIGTKIVFFTFLDKEWSAATILGAVGAIFIAPFFEEILYRGIPTEYLLSRNTKRMVIVLLTSFMFGLSHGPGIGHVLFFGLFGILLSLIYLKERNLWYCIILHFLYNSISLLIF